MKKNLLGITALTAALTLCTSITAFAGWIEDSNGWGYQRDDGTWVSGQWFTDPDTGHQYYMDPDGYIMTETRVEGYWLDANGIKHEKTEAEIEAEAAREARTASRPTPARKQAAAKQAAKDAKKATTAATTTRLSYQAEMKVFMDSIFIKAMDDDRALETYTVYGDTVENNLETTYNLTSSGAMVLTSTLGLNSSTSSANYTPYAIEFTYNRNTLGGSAEAAVFDTAYKSFTIAALGETEGAAVADRMIAEELGNGASFDQNGTTDTGNFYELTYRNGIIVTKVTCSEVEPVEETTEETAAETTQEETQEETTTEETAATTSVITVGQGSSAEAEATDEAVESSEEAAEGSEETAEGSEDSGEAAEASDTAEAADEADTAAAADSEAAAE